MWPGPGTVSTQLGCLVMGLGLGVGGQRGSFVGQLGVASVQLGCHVAWLGSVAVGGWFGITISRSIASSFLLSLASSIAIASSFLLSLASSLASLLVCLVPAAVVDSFEVELATSAACPRVAAVVSGRSE